MEENEKVRVRVLVSGLVQGVFFRINTKNRAKELNVFGWVKNLSDGQVEAMLEGKKENVQKLIEWMQKGPPFAKVSDIKTEWQEYKNEFNNFNIRYS